MGYEVGSRLKNEVKRYRSDAEIRKDQIDAMELTDKTLDYLNSSFDPFNALGYSIGAEEKTPKSKDLPRVFVLHQGKDGVIHPMSPEEAGLKPGSRAFWKAAQRGDLFAYPSGSKDVVQIQMRKEGKNPPKIGYSKPVDPAGVELFGALKQPNFFKRMLHGINKNWFKEVDAYENQQRSIPELRGRLAAEAEARGEDRALLERELAETKAAEAGREAAEKKAGLDRMVKEAEKRRDRLKVSMQYSEAIFEPEPKIYAPPEDEKRREELQEKYPGRTADDEIHRSLLRHGESIYGFMDEKEYNDLTQLGKDKLDLDSIKLGDGDRTVSKSEFCALALFTTMSNDIVMNTQKEGPAMCHAYDPSAQEGLRELGYSDKEVRDILGSCGVSMFTTDTYIHPPRSGSGRFIKDTIDIGRKRTADALNAYKNGDLEPLGRLLANGVAKQAGSAAYEQSGYGYEFAGSCGAARTMLGLMEADPRLKDAALKAGMDRKDLAVVEGAAKLCELDEKACEANVKLAKAERDGAALSTEEKQALAQDILTAQLAFRLMVAENSKQKTPEIDKMLSHAGEKSASKKEMKNMNILRQNRPKGKLWPHTAAILAETMKSVYRKKPESITAVRTPTGMENLRATALEIVRREKLAEKTPGELVKTLGVNLFEYGMKGLAEKGLLIMQEKGMLKPEVTKEIRAELGGPVRETPEAQKTAEDKQLEEKKPAAAPDAATAGI